MIPTINSLSKSSYKLTLPSIRKAHIPSGTNILSSLQKTDFYSKSKSFLKFTGSQSGDKAANIPTAATTSENKMHPPVMNPQNADRNHTGGSPFSQHGSHPGMPPHSDIPAKIATPSTFLRPHHSASTLLPSKPTLGKRSATEISRLDNSDFKKLLVPINAFSEKPLERIYELKDALEGIPGKSPFIEALQELRKKIDVK